MNGAVCNTSIAQRSSNGRFTLRGWVVVFFKKKKTSSVLPYLAHLFFLVVLPHMLPMADLICPVRLNLEHMTTA